MLDQECRNAFQACSAQALMEDRSKIRLKKEQERRERINDAVEVNKKSTLPVVEELKALVEGLQEQNRILQSQIDEAKKESEEANKEARKAYVFSWVSFGVATIISIAALLVSIIGILD